MTAISDIINDDNFVKVRGVGRSRLFLKIEALNPAGSIKMKTALGMIRDFEQRDLMKDDTILIESSSGSLGVALSIICAERGYRFVCIVDPNTAHQNIQIMQALGAQVICVDQRDRNGGYLGTRIAHIKDLLACDKRYLWLNQYANPENPKAHARTTAHAILRHFKHVDYLFVGAGTTGTLMGCIQFFSQHSPHTRIIAVDSIGSVTFGHAAGPRHIPGLGTSSRPEIFAADGIYATEMIAEADTVAMCRHLARSNGILAGGSTGTVLCAVQAWSERIAPEATVVAISPDFGERYLNTIYNDDWVRARFHHIPMLAKDGEPVSASASLA